MHISHKAVEPPGEARSDLDIFMDFARRMDFKDKDGKPLIKWKDPEHPRAANELADQKEMYGRIRLGGTIGYGFTALLAGVLVQRYRIGLAFWGCAFLFLLTLIVAQKLIHNPQQARGSSRGGIGRLLANRRWQLFLAVAFAGGLAQAGTSIYQYPYLGELGTARPG